MKDHIHIIRPQLVMQRERLSREQVRLPGLVDDVEKKTLYEVRKYARETRTILGPYLDVSWTCEIRADGYPLPIDWGLDMLPDIDRLAERARSGDSLEFYVPPREGS